MFIAALLTIIVPAGAATSRDSSAPTAQLELTAQAAELHVARRDPGRRLLQLPPLIYRFQLRARCADGGQAAAFSLNVADSRVTLQQTELADDTHATPREFDLTVPSDQLAPLALSNFCVAESDVRKDEATVPVPPLAEELLVPAVLAAQASLLCTGADAQSMTYVSTPLDLRLVCDASPGQTAEPEAP